MAQDPWAVVSQKPIDIRTGASSSESSPSGPWSVVSNAPVDFTSNPNSEGTYKMVDSKGQAIGVPYSRISDASKSGYKMHSDDRSRYLKDAAADPQLNDPTALPKGVKVVGKNSAGQPMYGTDDSQQGSAVSRFKDSFVAPIEGAVKGMYQSATQGPQNEQEDATERVLGPIQMRAQRMFVQPQIDEFKQAVSADSPLAGASHAMAAVVPMVGPWVEQASGQVGAQLGSEDYAGAAGTVAGNAALYYAPDVVKDASKVIPKTARSVAESITRTGPKELKKLAEETHQANLDAIAAAGKKDIENAQDHLSDTQDALHKTKGAELAHDAEVKAAKAKADEANAEAARKHLEDAQGAVHQTTGNELEHQAKVKAENDAAQSKHAADVAAVKAKNERVVAKHKAVSDRISQENNAAEHALELRRTEEAKLQQDTAAYYAKEDAVKAQAKQAENEAWKPWRDKMKGVEIDGGEISGPLAKLTAASPDLTRMMHQLIPDPVDAAPDSMYAQDRAAIMKSQGIAGDYWEQPPERRAIIDSIAKSSGFEPEAVDFNPEAGKGISIEQVHRAKSILGKNIASGRYEGYILGEMKQLLTSLEQAETRASLKAGALDDLKSARAATREYHEAFGKDKYVPKTQDEIFKKQANPEQFKEDHDQERLEAAKKYDPTLADDYKSVKARRDAVKKMKTEDQLRASIKQVPKPPTVGDLREGYKLEPEPTPPQPKPVTPPSRGEIPDRPATIPPKEVAPPERTAPPDRPPNTVPKTETISPDDIKNQRGKSIQKFTDRLREMGVRRALYSMAAGLSGAVPTAVLGHPTLGLAADIAAGLSVLGGSHVIASLLDKPSVVEWLSKISQKDVAEWEKLPSDQRALFTEDMRQLAEAAKVKGVSISPAMTKFIAGTGRNQSLSLNELRQEALRRNPNAVKVTAPDGSVHLFQDETAAANFRTEAGIQ